MGLAGPPRGVLAAEMRSSSQVLEDEGRWHGMPGCWYGSEFSSVQPQQGCEFSCTSAVGEGGGEEFW
jgi:hypothetical protein